MEDFIKLKKSNIVNIGIQDEYGNNTGEHLTFDLEDIELPLKYQEAQQKHKENIEFVRNQYIIIEKKQDKKGKKLLSWKQEEKIKVLNQYYRREEEALDLFLGPNGTKKMLNGRNYYYSMFDDIAEALEPIIPKLKISADEIMKKIKDKYSNKQEKNVI